MAMPNLILQQVVPAMDAVNKQLGMGAGPEYSPGETSDPGLANLFDVVAQVTDGRIRELLEGRLTVLKSAVEEVCATVFAVENQISIHEHIAVLFSQGFESIKLACPEPRDIRDALTSVVSKCVVDLADADLAFVRQRNTDESFSLIGRPVLGERRDFPGTPPPVKLREEGFLVWNDVYPSMVNNGGVIIFPEPGKENTEWRTVLSAMRKRAEGRDQELAFVDAIRAEAVLLFCLKNIGLIGVAVAVRKEPYTAEDVATVRQRLERYRPMLESFFAMGSILNEFHFMRNRLALLNEYVPEVFCQTENPYMLFLKAATLFTCSKGIGWHRALIFVFNEERPSEARCVMALGGIGDGPGTRWIEKASTLRDYLRLCEAPEYHLYALRDDALYRMSQRADRGLIATDDAIRADCRIRGELTWDARGVAEETSFSPFVEYRDDEGCHRSPSILVADSIRTAFRDKASVCDHYVFPLLASSDVKSDSRRIPVGFVIVDNPYVGPTHMETKSKLLLTRNVCDSLSEAIGVRRKRHAAASPDSTCVDEKRRYGPRCKTSVEGTTGERNSEFNVATEQKVECVVEYFDEKKAHCLAWVSGLLVPVELPRDVLDAKGIKSNMHFWWSHFDRPDESVVADDIIPMRSGREQNGKRGESTRR